MVISGVVLKHDIYLDVDVLKNSCYFTCSNCRSSKLWACVIDWSIQEGRVWDNPSTFMFKKMSNKGDNLIQSQAPILITQSSYRPGKSGKAWKKVVSESQGTFLISPKIQGTFVSNADCHENQNFVIFVWKMLRFSFHAPGKTSLKMSKIDREICVQVR